MKEEILHGENNSVIREILIRDTGAFKIENPRIPLEIRINSKNYNLLIYLNVFS